METYTQFNVAVTTAAPLTSLQARDIARILTAAVSEALGAEGVTYDPIIPTYVYSVTVDEDDNETKDLITVGVAL